VSSRWLTHPAARKKQIFGAQRENYLRVFLSVAGNILAEYQGEVKPVINSFMEITHPAATKFKFILKETQTSWQEDYAKALTNSII